MSRISNHGLIQVAYLNLDAAFGICSRAKVTNVTIAANPYGWALRQLFDVGSFEPFIKLAGVTTNVCVSGARHFQVPPSKQNTLPVAKSSKSASLTFHSFVPSSRAETIVKGSFHAIFYRNDANVPADRVSPFC